MPVFQPNAPDPIIEILQLAAARGFQIMREREQRIAAGESATPLSTNAPTQGHLCDDGAKGNSRIARSPEDRTDERTCP